MKTRVKFRHIFLCISLAYSHVAYSGTTSTQLSISQSPLVVGGAVAPNVVLVVDDSGSMTYDFMPDNVWNLSDNTRFRSTLVNTIYYDPDPNVQYPAPVDAQGVSLGDADFENARLDGFSASSTRFNLGTQFTQAMSFNAYRTKSSIWGNHANYAIYNPLAAGCATRTAASIANDACYQIVQVTDAEKKKFANWYSYYRTRILTAKSNLSQAFATIGQSAMRVGYSQINTANRNIDGVSSGLVRGVRPFEGTSRTEFYNWLFRIAPGSGTPLRRSLNSIGQYYSRTDNGSPWRNDPTGSSPDATRQLACRQSYTIMTSDGYWNDGSIVADSYHNNDNLPGSPIQRPDGSFYTWTPQAPFKDGLSETLADIAMYYWKTDLQPSLENKVQSSSKDPAFWQHMSTFTIGIGVSGTVNATVDQILNGEVTPAWPTSMNGEEKVTDMLHAAVNSRGDFFSVKNPQQFSQALQKVLNSITERNAAAGVVAVNSSRLDANSQAYQTTFFSGDWTGELLAYSVDPTTGLASSAPLWKASAALPAAAGRKIFTINEAGQGKEFKWSELDASQKTLMGDNESILNWVRGDVSHDVAHGGTLRTRASNKLIGDIVNSDPLYVGPVDYGYGTASSISSTLRTSYIDRRVDSGGNYLTRPRVIYVGANDGMLHAFDASSGKEMFAYVPKNILGQLPELAKTDYTHRFLVDGSPKASDVVIDNEWKTVLVGSTGAGGRSYFGLNIDDPAHFSQSDVKWEFTHPDLGNTIGQASIVRLENGKWVAIFGNGYNSDSQNAALFVVDVATGELLKEIAMPSAAGVSNGLATPLPIDVDGNGSVDLVYAGDLNGNLWKFDLRGESSTWKVAIAGNKPLFQAVKDGVGQPITSKPQVRRHPDGGLMVYFGTGKFFLTTDKEDTSLQTLYGVRDECGSNTTSCNATVDRSQLLEQTMTEYDSHTFDGTTSSGAATSGTADVRVVSNNSLQATQKGFFIDLMVGGRKLGERVFSTPSVGNDRVIFDINAPSEDPCDAGGNGWTLIVDPFSGGRIDRAVFDLNNDGFFDDKDGISATVSVSGMKKRSGMSKGSTSLRGSDGTTTLLNSDPSGKPDETKIRSSVLVGRQSWIQLR